MVDLLIDKQPVVAEGNHQEFYLILLQHDRAHGGQMDAFGNWDKTITQDDVSRWMRRLRLLLD